MIKAVKSAWPFEAVLKNAGIYLKYGKAPCPFHDDKNPSFTVKGERGRCWTGCFNGDVIDFTAKYYSLDAKGAIKFLADRAGLKRHTPAELIKIEKARKEREERERTFKVWERRKVNTMAELLRVYRQQMIKGFTEEELEALLPLIKGIDEIEYEYETVFCTRNDAERRKLYEEEKRDGLQIVQFDTAPELFHRHLTDLGNAHRLVAQHRDDIRYNCISGKWLLFDGIRWIEDVRGNIYQKAKLTVKGIYDEAAQALDKSTRKELAEHAIKSESKQRLEAMIALAKTEQGIAITANELDSDPWKLNVLNGTIDLKKGELLHHNREDLITKLAPVEYDPEAPFPQWSKFLNTIMAGNRNIIDFLQLAHGYSLTGDTREQVIIIEHGGGANGKSTKQDIIREILGDYAKTTSFNTFLARNGEATRNDLAALSGTRFVSASEMTDGKRLDEGVVKQLCGGDEITARFLYGEYFTFRPSFKIWLACNHRPIIKDTSHAMWRRIRLIPFNVTISEAEQDKELPKKLRNESAGILTWMVQGCLKWNIEGLCMPKEVKAATEGYRAEQDTLASFLDEYSISDPAGQVKAGDLYDAYEKWSEENGEMPQSQRKFTQCLEEKGFNRYRGTGNKYVWTGLKLTSY